MEMKRILLVILAIVMVISGCSSSNETSISKSNSNSQGQEAEKSQDEQSMNEEESILQVKEIEGEKVDAFILNEAPMLSELVSSGELESIDKRLPVEDDIMVENLEKIGTYGGEFTFALTKAGWNTGKPIEQGLFRFREDGTVEPNVAKGYEVNDDNTVYTIYLREGMKWSDGVPFTSADSVFFYEHMCLPETFGKSLWDCFKVDNPETGEETIAEFKALDEYSFSVSFEHAKPGFIEALSINAKWCYAPKHYHEKILPEFVGEEKANEIANEMGFSDAVAMGKETGYYFWNVAGIPTLNPYVLSTDKGKSDVSGEYYEYVRNPYYFKTDQAGNQLPYVDKIEYTKIADESQGLLKLLGGEVSFSFVKWTDIGTVNENAEKVGYRIVQWPNSLWGDLASQLQLNQSVADEDLKALFQNSKFREALSIAVDRDEYSKLISDGWSSATQASPPKGTMGYSETWATKWTQYDVMKAQNILDEIGLVKGADGFYDFASGKKLVLNITSFTGSGADDTYVVLKQYFDALGIETTYQPVEKDLLNNRLTSNDFDVVLGPVAPAETVNIGLRPDTLVPVRNYAAWYGQFGNWYASGGTDGVAPEGDLLELTELYDKFKKAGTEEREDIALKMLKLHEENLWVIGYMGAANTLIAVDNNIKNFKDTSVFSDEFRGLGIAHIDTCFIEQ
jgi:peptide/nickel transport system substrate-binding protein